MSRSLRIGPRDFKGKFRSLGARGTDFGAGFIRLCRIHPVASNLALSPCKHAPFPYPVLLSDSRSVLALLLSTDWAKLDDVCPAFPHSFCRRTCYRRLKYLIIRSPFVLLQLDNPDDPFCLETSDSASARVTSLTFSAAGGRRRGVAVRTEQ